MNKCHAMEELLRKSAAGELTTAESDILQAHARECGDCREYLQLQENLRALGNAEIDYPLRGLEKMRLEVLRSASGVRKPRTFELRSWFQSLSLAWCAAAAMLVCGVLLGYFLSARREDREGLWVRQISRNARQSASFKDLENSPFVYSNVAFKQLEDDRMILSFDVTRHVDVQAARKDPLVKALLVQALLNPSPLGARLKAMSLVESIKDDEMKQALIVSMLNDESVAVRLKAQTILMSYKNDRKVLSAFLTVLRKDESTQMRLQALDYLVDNNVSRDALGEAVRDLQSQEQEQPAVLYKAKMIQNLRSDLRD